MRQDLREGVHPPGARLVATEIAEGLGLSATPVREALSRLAGEGLLEDRRGQGVFVRVLSGLEVADLWRLSLAQLALAQDMRRRPVPRTGLDAPRLPAEPEPDPVLRVERLFAGWIAEGGGRVLGLSHRAVQGQLAQARRVEVAIFRDLKEEAAALAALAPAERRGERLTALRRFHGRRVAAAGRLAALLYTRASGRDYSGDIV